jgi:hypothetical protein
MSQVLHEEESVTEREAAEQEVGLLIAEERREVQEARHVIEELEDTVIALFAELAVDGA